MNAGPTRNSTRNVSMDGSFVGLSRTWNTARFSDSQAEKQSDDVPEAYFHKI